MKRTGTRDGRNEWNENERKRGMVETGSAGDREETQDRVQLPTYLRG